MPTRNEIEDRIAKDGVIGERSALRDMHALKAMQRTLKSIGGEPLAGSGFEGEDPAA